MASAPSSSSVPGSASSSITFEHVSPFFLFPGNPRIIEFERFGSFTSAVGPVFSSSPSSCLFFSLVLNCLFFSYCSRSRLLFRTCLCNNVDCVYSRPATFDDIRDVCHILLSLDSRILRVLNKTMFEVNDTCHNIAHETIDQAMKECEDFNEFQKTQLTTEVTLIMKRCRRMTEKKQRTILGSIEESIKTVKRFYE